MLSCGEDRALEDLQSILGMFYFSQRVFSFSKFIPFVYSIPHEGCPTLQIKSR